MAHINLYRAFSLDQRASPDDLWRTLTGQLESTDPVNKTLRSQIETARAILSDPVRKQTYDARLADPTAPDLDPGALSELATTSWGTPTAATAPAVTGVATTAGGLLPAPILATIAAVLVAALAVFGVVVARDDSGGKQHDMTAASASHTPGGGDGPAQQEPSEAVPAPAPAAKASPPLPGAYPAAGGPRPPTAIPLPTYVSRYGKVKSAHLLTPTGGVGCDFQTAGSDGKQGQCGVRSMNTVNSPLGTERIGSSTKGKWLFPFSNNRVGAPYGSSGTTGWMNQPANDGYHVPRVEYGKQYYFEDWAIASEENGLTVWNTTTGSGVFLSNEKAETFDGPGGTTPSQQGGSGDETVVLGSLPSNGKGYGTTRPTLVHNGGGPTTGVKDITWSSWGGPTAEGVGTGTWQTAGLGSEEYIPANIIASEIGTCNGTRAYTRITWYFPTKGEKLGDRRLMDACWS